MNMLMFGRGVISVLYGWALEKACHRVEFYVRPVSAAKYGSPLKIDIIDARQSIRGKCVDESWSINLREEIPENHAYDLIFVSVQHYQFEAAAKFLASRVGGATILAFNNFWNDPQQAASALPADQLAWGFPGAGGGFGADQVLRGALLGKVTLGTFNTEFTARQLAVHEMFSKAGFAINGKRRSAPTFCGLTG